MADQELVSALDSNQEIQIIVTGRKSGQEISLPVWFARDGGRMYLVPVTGTDSNWFKNVLKEPAVRVIAGSAQLVARVTPVTDPARVSEILDMFRAKYGARDVAAYYPKPNVAVEVPLSRPAS
jgi:deazaflavin-dependent oxidoreductase (nitroreductase family)